MRLDGVENVLGVGQILCYGQENGIIILNKIAQNSMPEV